LFDIDRYEPSQMVAPVFRLRHQSFRTDTAEIPVCMKENRPKPRPEIIFNNFCLIRTRPLHFCYFYICKSFPVIYWLLLEFCSELRVLGVSSGRSNIMWGEVVQAQFVGVEGFVSLSQVLFW